MDGFASFRGLGGPGAAPPPGRPAAASAAPSHPLARRDVGDEAEALAMEGADEPLVLPSSPECLTCRLHAARERRVRHDPPVPDFLEDLVAGHQAVTVLDEQREQRENLGFQRAHGAPRPQFDSRESSSNSANR